MQGAQPDTRLRVAGEAGRASCPLREPGTFFVTRLRLRTGQGTGVSRGDRGRQSICRDRLRRGSPAQHSAAFPGGRKQRRPARLGLGQPSPQQSQVCLEIRLSCAFPPLAPPPRHLPPGWGTPAIPSPPPPVRRLPLQPLPGCLFASSPSPPWAVPG